MVTDSGGLFATRVVTITVRPFVHDMDEPVTVTDDVVINGAPMLDPISDQTVAVDATAQFTATAVDPGDTLTFSLVNAPATAAIDPLTGAFSWLTTAAGSFTFSVRVTDSGGLFAEEAVTITVDNLPPITVPDRRRSARICRWGCSGSSAHRRRRAAST